MGVLEEGGVLEAVAEEAVEGYVGRPDESYGGCEGVVGYIGDEEEWNGEEESVGEVVEG